MELDEEELIGFSSKVMEETEAVIGDSSHWISLVRGPRRRFWADDSSERTERILEADLVDLDLERKGEVSTEVA